jgi:hypothetical protein
MIWAGHVVSMGEMCTAFWWENLKRPLQRPKDRWEDNIKMVLTGIVCGVLDWILLVHIGITCCLL